VNPPAPFDKKELFKNSYYVNIHSAGPGGEIRGQIFRIKWSGRPFPGSPEADHAPEAGSDQRGASPHERGRDDRLGPEPGGARRCLPRWCLSGAS